MQSCGGGVERATLTVRRGSEGFGLVGLLVSFLTLALLAGISVAALGGTGGGGGTSGLPGLGGENEGGSTPSLGQAVSEAADIATQQNLQGALMAVQEVAATTGGYEGIDPDSLSTAEPELRFVTGPSTDDTTISVAGTAGGGTSEGAVSLAARAQSGTCWYAWATSGATWFGAQPAQTRCTAPALSSPPAAGSASPGRIGWQAESFPSP